jgi:hypothetical protein
MIGFRSNMDQVERYQPPPNVAKEADSRFAAYVKKYGRACWELDALAPNVIADLIRAEVEALIDPEAWSEAAAREAESRALMNDLTENWALVENTLRGEK